MSKIQNRMFRALRAIEDKLSVAVSELANLKERAISLRNSVMLKNDEEKIEALKRKIEQL